jgi:hypothetical protein
MQFRQHLYVDYFWRGNHPLSESFQQFFTTSKPGHPHETKIPNYRGAIGTGADDENRTHVTALRRQRNATIRHQLTWSCWWGSNPRPPLYQSGILPLNYNSLVGFSSTFICIHFTENCGRGFGAGAGSRTRFIALQGRYNAVILNQLSLHLL